MDYGYGHRVDGRTQFRRHCSRGGVRSVVRASQIAIFLVRVRCALFGGAVRVYFGRTKYLEVLANMHVSFGTITTYFWLNCLQKLSKYRDFYANTTSKISILLKYKSCLFVRGVHFDTQKWRDYINCSTGTRSEASEGATSILYSTNLDFCDDFHWCEKSRFSLCGFSGRTAPHTSIYIVHTHHNR